MVVVNTKSGTQAVLFDPASPAVSATLSGSMAVYFDPSNPSVNTELPDALSLADNASNPTAPAVGSFGMNFDGSTWDRKRSVAALGDAGTAADAAGIYIYNGATWDRVRGDITNGILVNLGANNDVVVSQDSQSVLDHGSNLDIDATAEQITTTSFSAKKGVILKCPSANTGILYIGNSDVTAGTTAATDGIPLEPGESLFIEVNNPNLLYAISDTADQKIFWMAV